jgi:hypothetical protein
MPLPLAEKAQPFHPAFACDDDALAPWTWTRDFEPSDSASDQERAQWRLALAERPLQEAEQA